jgi:acyl carrier protein
MADRATIRQTLLDFLQEDTGIEVDKVEETTAFTDMALDSIDFVGLIMRIEGHYRIRLARPELEQLKVVGDLLTLIENKLKAPAAAA